MRAHKSTLWVLATLCVAPLLACAQSDADSFRWTKFVQVEGQPEPVPAEWVSTPEGRFAHALKIPNPVPKDSGYRWWMSSQQYFDHLCKTEAGEFIFRKVENVKGLYLARPPLPPTDSELKSRYRLEAPELERFFQLLRATPEERSLIFVRSQDSYKFVEESIVEKGASRIVRAYGFIDAIRPRQSAISDVRQSQYGLTWRGLRREADRSHEISGSEWIVYDLTSSEILGVFRNFGRTGVTPNVSGGIWWLNAFDCPNVRRISTAAYAGTRLFHFVSSVLIPTRETTQ
jgi:hypothetical protein